MKILAIETATETCSVALLCNDQITTRYEHQPQKQAHLVLPMVDELMAEAELKPKQLDAVAFGAGPGSFTGLRIAAAVTQAIAVSADLPVVPVSTLATLAQGVYRQYGSQAVLASIDARMKEIYWGAYKLAENGLMQLEGQELVVSPDEVPVPDGDEWIGAGSGWRAQASILEKRIKNLQSIKDDCWPQAQDVLTLAVPLYQQGKTVAAESAEPIYLRNKVAKSIAEREAEQE
ncbi:MAG: tRNA (adenosine(37)-N6)-threonylcarbamoyltransferase complex dimerization subunit type 1 TsaB [Gammaproteobacteria bacterium]|nr:tRNA (adenosine(37)-N6)-threonylcarbamoyltransferase complex dimerization subunit type 1 TsaB [Gammaproteobacteria bacterium]